MRRLWAGGRPRREADPNVVVAKHLGGAAALERLQRAERRRATLALACDPSTVPPWRALAPSFLFLVPDWPPREGNVINRIELVWGVIMSSGSVSPGQCMIGTTMMLDLSDNEKLALIALLKRTIGDDPYPLSPRIRMLKAILAKIEPPAAAAAESHPPSRPDNRLAAVVRARSRRRTR
jgi:hypothetical protein